MQQRTPEEMKAIIDAYVDKKREAGEQPDMHWFTRLLYGGLGAGIIRGNLTPIIAGLKGNADLWHASPAHNIMPNDLGGGILNEGLDLRHAGKNQRANSLLMRNSAQSLVEEILGKKGKKISPEDEQYLYDMIAGINQEAGATTEAALKRGLSGAVGTGDSAAKAIDRAVHGFADNLKKQQSEASLGYGDAAHGSISNINPNVADDLKDFSAKNFMASATEGLNEGIRSHEVNSMRDAAGNFKPLADRVMDRIPELSKRFNIPEEELRDYFNKNMSRLGKRIYFGTRPESVSYWGGLGNEVGFAGKKIVDDMGLAKDHDLGGQLKQMGSMVLNQLTGGYSSELKEKLKYGKPETVTKLKNLEELKAHLGGMGSALHDHNVLMNFSVPAQTLDSMVDFPVVRRLIQSSPGLKETMGKFLPQSDPSKDMSISENINPKNIKGVDLVDNATGKVKQRIHLSEHEKAPFKFLGGKGNRLKTLKNMAMPLALTGFGGSLLYKALAPNKKKKNQLADEIPDVDQNIKTKKIVKKAAADPKVIAALLGIPTAAGLAMAGANRLIDKATKREHYQYLPEELESKFTPEEKERYRNKFMNEVAKGQLGMAAGNLGATALGTFADPSILSHRAAIGGYLGSTMGAPIVGQNVQFAFDDPGAVLPFADKFPKVDKFIREHPYLTGGLIGGLTMGAVPASIYHIAKKYYPYHTKEIVDKIKNTGELRNVLKDLSNDFPGMAGPKGKSFMNHMKQSIKHLPISTFFPALGLGGAAVGVGAGMLIDRGLNKTMRKVEEHNASLADDKNKE